MSASVVPQPYGAKPEVFTDNVFYQGNTVNASPQGTSLETSRRPPCCPPLRPAGTSLAAKFLRSQGIRLLDLREETVQLLGKADMYFFSPEHPPLTEPASQALEWAISQHKAKGRWEVGSEGDGE